jgi:hypothetical protein
MLLFTASVGAHLAVTPALAADAGLPAGAQPLVSKPSTHPMHAAKPVLASLLGRRCGILPPASRSP